MKISRKDYYFELERVLKANCKMPLCIEADINGEWTPIDKKNPKINKESNFRINYTINNKEFIIPERNFDKFYLPMISYKNKGDVEYRDTDIIISKSNLIYQMMQQLQQWFLTPYEN